MRRWMQEGHSTRAQKKNKRRSAFGELATSETQRRMLRFHFATHRRLPSHFRCRTEFRAVITFPTFLIGHLASQCPAAIGRLRLVFNQTGNPAVLILPSFTELYRGLPSFTEFYRVVPSLIWFFLFVPFFSTNLGDFRRRPAVAPAARRPGAGPPLPDAAQGELWNLLSTNQRPVNCRPAHCFHIVVFSVFNKTRNKPKPSIGHGNRNMI